MRVTLFCLTIALVGRPSFVAAQHGAAPGARGQLPPKEASQLDFLIGQWELVVRPKVAGLAARIHGSPKLVGTWNAWRAFDQWGVEDELRILDGSGNPMSLTHTMRVFDPAAKRWNQTSLDPYRARFSTAQAAWTGAALEVSGAGTDQEGRAYRSRTRFTAITPSAFRYEQDRSLDDGKTWDEKVLVIEAKRISATAAR